METKLDPKRIGSVLSRTALVSALPHKMQGRFVDLILGIARDIDSHSGDVLFKLGEKNVDEGLFILEGAVKVTRANGDVRFLEAPEVLGEVQLFAPGGERTATVETVYGGAMLRFSWKELAAAAKKEFSPAEMGALRNAIRDSADAREQNLLVSLLARQAPPPEQGKKK